MAGDLDFQNEDFEEQNMKPTAGEETNVLWARQLAGNVAHLYYNHPAIWSVHLSIAQPPAANTYTYFDFHKPSFVNTFLIRWRGAVSDNSGNFRVWVDGTACMDSQTLNTSWNNNNNSIALGATGQDEWLVGTMVNFINPQGFTDSLKLNIQIHPDWDSI